MVKEKKFKGERYAAAGISAEILFSYQLAIWQCLELFQDEDIEVDYFQVFEIRCTYCG